MLEIDDYLNLAIKKGGRGGGNVCFFWLYIYPYKMIGLQLKHLSIGACADPGREHLNLVELTFKMFSDRIS